MAKELIITKAKYDALAARHAEALAEIERLTAALRAVARHHHHQFGLWRDEDFGNAENAIYHRERRDWVLGVLE